jgi:glyoxylase-like metal-dependent hydrolase (beta-lactamase superfamily II)
MRAYICVTCGTQFAPSAKPASRCAICEDERQYVGADGQQWTTLDALRLNHRVVLREEEPGLTGIGCEPSFAIGQRALLVRSPAGNLLWDCLTLIDDEAIASVRALGGISAIAVSHPHFYSAVVEWSHAFGNAPIYLHVADRQHVMRPDAAMVFWDGDALPLKPGLTLVRCGGHFEGSSVLHWRNGAEGRGALLTGDTVYVVSDRRYVSFMSSYPNLIPLPAKAIDRIVHALAPYPFDRIYSAWFGRVCVTDGKAALTRSAERYKRALSGSGRR